MKCHGYLLCESIDISLIKSEAKYKQVAVLTHNDSTCFVFPYGAMIIWGTGDLFHFESMIGNLMKKKLPASERLVDEFEVKPAELIKLIHEDVIYLAENSLEIKFSISHAIAQSLRLSHIEDDVLRLMKVNR
ncbi:MAG: RMD1 family protein, partial [Bacteriovoracaceae bacterium]|nr:RMD1 family protein [Bacteriovoracaceae bacterium]